MKRSAVLLLAALAACSTYQPRPLVEHELLEELRAVRLELPEDGLDAAQAVALALVHNPELQIWRRRHEIASGRVVSAGLWERWRWMP